MPYYRVIKLDDLGRKSGVFSMGLVWGGGLFVMSRLRKCNK